MASWETTLYLHLPTIRDSGLRWNDFEIAAELLDCISIHSDVKGLPG